MPSLLSVTLAEPGCFPLQELSHNAHPQYEILLASLVQTRREKENPSTRSLDDSSGTRDTLKIRDGARWEEEPVKERRRQGYNSCSDISPIGLRERPLIGPPGTPRQFFLPSPLLATFRQRFSLALFYNRFLGEGVQLFVFIFKRFSGKAFGGRRRTRATALSSPGKLLIYSRMRRVQRHAMTY
ncbi:unnamed protein product [Lampetra fluviatilis]